MKTQRVTTEPSGWCLLWREECLFDVYWELGVLNLGLGLGMGKVESGK